MVNKSIREYLPDVPSNDLEENGNIYYMNGKNGTEFDWYVPVYTLILVQFTGFNDLILREEIVNLAVCVIVGGLRTIFAVLRAAPTSSVNNGAEVHLVPDQSCPDTISALA